MGAWIGWIDEWIRVCVGWWNEWVGGWMLDLPVAFSVAMIDNNDTRQVYFWMSVHCWLLKQRASAAQRSPQHHRDKI